MIEILIALLVLALAVGIVGAGIVGTMRGIDWMMDRTHERESRQRNRQLAETNRREDESRKVEKWRDGKPPDWR